MSGGSGRAITLRVLLDRESEVDWERDFLGGRPDGIQRTRCECAERLVVACLDHGLSNRIAATAIEQMDRCLRALRPPAQDIPCIALGCLSIAHKMGTSLTSKTIRDGALGEMYAQLTLETLDEVETRINSVLKWELGTALWYLFLDSIVECIHEQSAHFTLPVAHLQAIIKVTTFYIDLGILDYETCRLSPSALTTGAFISALNRLASPDTGTWEITLCRRFGLHRAQVSQSVLRLQRAYYRFNNGWSGDTLFDQDLSYSPIQRMTPHTDSSSLTPPFSDHTSLVKFVGPDLAAKSTLASTLICPVPTPWQEGVGRNGRLVKQGAFTIVAPVNPK